MCVSTKAGIKNSWWLSSLLHIIWSPFFGKFFSMTCFFWKMLFCHCCSCQGGDQSTSMGEVQVELMKIPTKIWAKGSIPAAHMSAWVWALEGARQDAVGPALRAAVENTGSASSWNFLRELKEETFQRCVAWGIWEGPGQCEICRQSGYLQRSSGYLCQMQSLLILWRMKICLQWSY